MWIQSQVRINLPTLLILVLCFGASVERLASANEQVLRSFGGELFRDAQYPQASVVQGLDGALYGTSTSGGTNNAGALFRINVDGSGYQVLYVFGGTNSGADPCAGLVQGADGTLFGTTSRGGTNGYGTIFRVNPDGSGYTTLHSFVGPIYVLNGLSFSSLTLGPAGNLYGTISTGSNGVGSIFKIAPDGTGFQVLHSLPGESGEPFQGALLLGADGAFYGTVPGGGAYGEGLVFKVNADGSGYRELYQFGAVTNDAAVPQAALVASADGTLYGTTVAGGTYGVGTIFQIQPDGTGYQILLSLQGAVRNPLQSGLLFGADGWLYGVFAGGGTTPGQVFRFNPALRHFEVLHDFSYNPAFYDGAHPQAALILGTNGVLYGTTYDGGTNNVGTIFHTKTDGTGFGLLYSFANATADGAYPVGGLVQGVDQALYGVTQGGGTNGYGTVFRLGPDGTGYSILHAFLGGSDGAEPSAGLVLGLDNGLYGVTGAGNAGAVFRLDSDGSNYHILHSFGLLSSDGIAPGGALIVGTDGVLYGTTTAGGTSNLGTIFRLDPSGTGYLILHSFAGGSNDGAIPISALVQGLDKNLYGVTQRGGQYNAGTLFKIATNGAGFELLHEFLLNYPYAPQSLTRTALGTLFGTSGGGLQNAGTVFRLNPDGTGFTVLYNFDRNPFDGDYPSGALVQGSDGTLYGTTQASGTNGPGVAFSLQPDGTGFTVLHRFGSIPSDGERPQGGLVIGVDGALYGVTSGGGSTRSGTVFRLSSVSSAPPPPFQLSIMPVEGGTFRVSCNGVLGLTYVLQTSTDLSNWASLGSVSNESGTVDFLEWNGANNPQRFYRMLQTR